MHARTHGRRYRAGDVGDTMLMNLVQTQVAGGSADTKVFAVAESRKAAQFDTATRDAIGGNDIHGTIEEAAGGGAGAHEAAKEAQSIMMVTQ